MADELKRVGLVFKEDGSTDFVKSLKLVNATLKENYETFKLTQAQWDKSTTTSQKLRDKLVYLNEAYDIQNDKVTTLKIQLEELENAENKDEVAIQKKKATLTQAETSLQRYKNQIDETTNKLKTSSEAIKEFGKNVEEKGNKIEKAGKKISAFSIASLTALTASTKGAIEFEDAFTGVEKTVDATDEQLKELKTQIRQMAKEIPASTTEIAGVAEAAGQLGIKTEDIMNFTRVMIDLGNSTNLSADEAASALAKFANVTKMSASNYSNLGSVIVALGNNFATTEADIVSMATRLAATGELTGLSQAQIMGLATTMSSVGIEAEAGGSAMSKLLKNIQIAVETGSKDLKDFAKVSGMTTKEFKKAYEEDAVKALSAFISGLNETKRNGKSAIAILDDMGLTEVRLSNTILSLASSGRLMNDAIDLANKSWEENNALSNEANKRYETLKSKTIVALNKIKDMGITLGNKLMPAVEKVLNKIGDWTNKFNELNSEQVETIVNIGLLIATLSPVISTLGKMTTGIGQAISAYSKFREGLGLLVTKAEASGSAMKGLLGVIQGMTGPVGLACIAIGAAITGIIVASNKANKEVKKDFETMGTSASDFIKGIDNATSHLSSFNSTLFATAEEQQALRQNMDEIQKGITDICKRASDERRGYTEEEITQLDEYFTKLRELKDREIQIQNEIAKAIAQQAITNAQSFQGSLEEYKIQSQEWIKTATEQKDSTVALIEQGTIEEIALLNQRYTTEEERQSEAYQKEYATIMEQKQAKIDAATEEVAKVTEVYANGYLERSKQNDGFYSIIEEFNKKIENENNRHNSAIEGIENNGLLTQYNKNTAKKDEEYRHNEEMKSIWKKMYKNMSDSQAEQLGVWLAIQADTEMYGGKISDETQRMVDTIMDSYDSMPDDTRKAMKNAMTPMLEEMQNKEPSLFAEATGIANGILRRLRKSFDIRSPSRKTRQIMKFVMQPMEEEMETGKRKLINNAEQLADGVIGKFNEISSESLPNNIEAEIKANSIEPRSSYDSARKCDFDYEKFGIVILKALENSKIFQYLEEIIASIKSGKTISIGKEALVGVISEEIDYQLGNISKRKSRGG